MPVGHAIRVRVAAPPAEARRLCMRLSRGGIPAEPDDGTSRAEVLVAVDPKGDSGAVPGARGMAGGPRRPRGGLFRRRRGRRGGPRRARAPLPQAARRPGEVRPAGARRPARRAGDGAGGGPRRRCPRRAQPAAGGDGQRRVARPGHLAHLRAAGVRRRLRAPGIARDAARRADPRGGEAARPRGAAGLRLRPRRSDRRRRRAGHAGGEAARGGAGRRAALASGGDPRRRRAARAGARQPDRERHPLLPARRARWRWPAGAPAPGSCGFR